MSDAMDYAGDKRQSLASIKLNVFGPDYDLVDLIDDAVGITDPTWENARANVQRRTAILDAIHGHYAAAISDLTARLAEAERGRDEWQETVAKAIMRLPTGYGQGERGQGLLEGITGLRTRATAAEAAVAIALEVMKPFEHRAFVADKLARTTYKTERWTPELLNAFRRARDFIRDHGGVK